MSVYTVKVHWTRFRAESRKDPTYVDDEMTHFIPADEVTAHSQVPGAAWQDQFKHWDAGDYDALLCVTFFEDGGEDGETVDYQDGRLIRVVRDGVTRWILASHAWLLGPDGRTIERLA